MAKKTTEKDIPAGDVAVDPVVVDAPVLDAPVADPAPENVVSPLPLAEVSMHSRFPVRADVTFNDGSVKSFSGEAQDSELDLSKIEVNG